MKVMLRNNQAGHLIVYVAKKDLEEVVKTTDLGEESILTLANGWELAIASSTDLSALPKTVEARRINS